VEHLPVRKGRHALKRVGILAYIMPGEDPAVGDGVIRDERVQIEMRQPGAVAVPLVGDASGEILENTELEINAWIERPPRPPQEPTRPIGILFPNGRDVLAAGHVPARTIEVPTLADGDDLAELPASHDVAYPLLVWTAQPL